MHIAFDYYCKLEQDSQFLYMVPNITLPRKIMIVNIGIDIHVV
jgi:hypothetical protein